MSDEHGILLGSLSTTTSIPQFSTWSREHTYEHTVDLEAYSHNDSQEEDPEPLDQYLKPKAKDNKDIRRFLKDYSQIKDRQGSNLLNSLLWYHVFQRSLVASAANYSLSFPEDSTFSQCSEYLQKRIRASKGDSKRDSLHLW